MEQVAKHFSLIDFLGIALPGAVLVLTINYYIWDLTAPCTKFFGLNTVVLAVYFVALSYLCGGILHQLGIAVEHFLPDEKNVFVTHCQQDAIKKVTNNDSAPLSRMLLPHKLRLEGRFSIMYSVKTVPSGLSHLVHSTP